MKSKSRKKTSINDGLILYTTRMSEELSKIPIDELIIAFLSKSATPEEQEYLLNWVESSALNKGYYDEIYTTWLRSAQIVPSLSSEHVEQALLQVQRKASGISVADKRRQSKAAQKTMLPRNFFKYAAAVVLLVASTYGITKYSVSKNFEYQVSEMEYEAHYGSRAFALLPDSSKVWLNSGSKLSVMSGYNFRERTVQLVGEAYFEVKTNPEKPFIVKAGNIAVNATGTAFNVKAYPEEERIITTLVEGVVVIKGVDNQDKEFSLPVTPGQSISYYKQKSTIEDVTGITDTQMAKSPDGKPVSTIPATVRQVNTDALTSWMRDRWIIDSEDFGSLAVKLERRYNVEIRFESEDLKKYRFTGTIERETLEQMFEAFRYSIPLKYAIDKGVVVLTEDKYLKEQYEKAWKHK